jgi:hypothetical protein
MYSNIKMKPKKLAANKPMTLPVNLPLLPGSLSTARSTCGKPQCPCHDDPARLHGVYYRWTGVLQGKRTTKTLSQAEAAECRARIKNYRQLQKTVDRLLRQALKEAPWEYRKQAADSTRA